MTKKKFALLVSCSALLTATAFASGDPVRIVTRSYPGVACQPAHGGLDGYRAVDGSIRNESSSAHGDYLCPVRADSVYKGRQFMHAYVRVIDAHDDASVTCHIYTYTKDRMPSGWTMRATSKAGFSSSPQTLNLSGQWAPERGHVTLRCTVPEKRYGRSSSVVAYHAD